MKLTSPRYIILAALALLIVAWAGIFVSQSLGAREYTVPEATITKLDVATRTGEIQFIHPQKGHTITLLTQRIPDDCEITINNRAATLAEVRVGDLAEIVGLAYADRTVVPLRVRITRDSTQEGDTVPAPVERTDGPAPRES
ncbi:MAG: hypothetical protein IPM18_01990 [Phycisphaerales bacterium]|nr:hypothetical protein [Phycisphaerales bacterium]